MGRQINRLNARFVQMVAESGQYADGNGLYLLTTNGGKRWIFVFRWQGKRREMGLGSFRDVSLADARDLAAQARGELNANRNPIDLRNAERAANSGAVEESVQTFGAFADSYIASVEDGWRNAKHRQQWRNSLSQHAAALSPKSVAEISTQDVLAVLQPIWLRTPETASRLRGRIEKVLNAAKARGHRSADSINPAQWRGHLEILLPKRQRLTRGHHAAMPYSTVQDFLRDLADRPAMAARALAFLILTAGRSGEVLGADWGEIDGDLWSIPAERMKGGVAHTVTLTPAAAAILDAIGRGEPGSQIFRGPRGGALSNMALAMLMRRMGVGNYTVHGFRSSFKDWAVDCTDFADEISEEALAHIVGSRVRRAYRRGEALDRRRKLMDAWADYLDSPPVLAIVREEAA